MARRFIIREDAKPIAVVQIMTGLIHIALGTLWIHFYFLNEEEPNSVGPVPICVMIYYLFVSSFFFINSGASSVFQKPPTRCKLVYTIVMNILSICMAIIGLIIIIIESLIFESKGVEYSWSNVHLQSRKSPHQNILPLHNLQRTSMTPIKNKRIIVN
ncbi:B-lymphocyte antigen CD20-like isoform X2 [Tupaia chinensis]|uniref:B-lymphocyte antigen CD20-like isoform X2 n=1 Tax=Tupaia chinensis TaxID=246437 RepID=UPI0003C8FA65|nr:B-lymphocyte antigen CD20-like isoform X2 [Tupaia chinensis]